VSSRTARATEKPCLKTPKKKEEEEEEEEEGHTHTHTHWRTQDQIPCLDLPFLSEIGSLVSWAFLELFMY
jgi:hypothetical protein